MAQTVKKLYSPEIQEIQVWSLGQEDPLENVKAPHTSILAWRTPWKYESGRLQSMGLQRVRHNWATNSFTFLFRSMTYFKLLYMVWSINPASFFWMWIFSCLYTICWKAYWCPIGRSWQPCQILTIKVKDFLWTLDFIPLIYISRSLLVPYCIEYCSFVVILKWKASVLFFFKIVLSSLGSLHLNINFKL